jgi:putative phage-type endonuclease
MPNTKIQTKIEKQTGAVFLGNYQAGSDEWLALRKTGIGGSEVAAICGLSKWTSPYTLWCQKTGRISDSVAPNDAMEWGNRLEPVIIDKFESEHPELRVYRDVGTWRHKDREFQVTNPDAIYETEDGELGILEIKTAMYEDDWKEGVPRYYETQVQWYMQTFGIKRGYVAVLFHGNSYREYEIEANDFAQGIALSQVEGFLHYVETDAEPDFDGSKSTMETVRSQHPDIDPDLTVELGDLGIEYFKALKANEETTSELNLLKSLVMKEMGNAKTGLVYDTVGFVRQSRGGSTPFLIYKGGK